MPFFIRERTQKRRKPPSRPRNQKGSFVDKSGKKPPAKYLDEEISSDEDEDFSKKKKKFYEQSDDESSEEEQETAQEKKVRLAKQYLKELQAQKAQEKEDEEEIEDEIGQRLEEEVLEAAGKLQKTVADTFVRADTDGIHVLRCKQHKLSITCVVVSSDDQTIYSTSKDSSIVKWSIDGKRLAHVLGARKDDGDPKTKKAHSSHIYSLALSSDGKYLATGDKSGYILTWDASTLEHLKTFKKHRGAVTGLAFRRGTHTLYSCSHDRLVMVWNLDAMAFVENLGGHQDAITGIDALARESCITSGGRDESVIVYVILDDKQLRFSGHQGSVDGVRLLNERTFVTFGQDGSLAVWTTLKKKPHCTIKLAHGVQESNQEGNWITSVATLVNTDLIASGSFDGCVRLWKVDTRNFRKMELLFTIPVKGIVNSMCFTSDGSHLVVGVGQEHKLGRWYTDKTAKNSVCVIPLVKE
ncbi:U3 small nuclear riboprotein factor 55K isoform X2 [Oratosquilla oratoria]|uniref:U3 small nuclear riboprotein factor 55K isoform X2 n=1 Tax=Oratosquilla oratoria TaxID=337810 RepID=UPI003F75B2AA